MRWFISDFIRDYIEDNESPGTAADSIQGNKESRGGNVSFRGGKGAVHQQGGIGQHGVEVYVEGGPSLAWAEGHGNHARLDRDKF